MRSDKDTFGVPFHVNELKALHPNSEVMELEKAPRFVVVIREPIDAERVAQFQQTMSARGIELLIFCLGNAKANPNECVFGNLLESM